MGFQCPAYAEEDWLTHSRQILKSLEGQSRPAWLDNNPNTADAKREAMELMNGSGSALPLNHQSANPPVANTSKSVTVMFISFSLGDAALKGIFHEASGHDDVLLVFRGPKPQQKLPQLFAELKTAFERHRARAKYRYRSDPIPEIWRLPQSRKFVVENQGKARLQVKGVTSLDWVKPNFSRAGKGILAVSVKFMKSPKSICCRK